MIVHSTTLVVHWCYQHMSNTCDISSHDYNSLSPWLTSNIQPSRSFLPWCAHWYECQRTLHELLWWSFVLQWHLCIWATPFHDFSYTTHHCLGKSSLLVFSMFFCHSLRHLEDTLDILFDVKVPWFPIKFLFYQVTICWLILMLDPYKWHVLILAQCEHGW